MTDLPTLLSRAAPKVKPLVWEGDPDAAKTPFGGYYISERFHADALNNVVFVWCHSSRCDTDESDGVFLSISDAKAAAQADYEARILSAIEPDTQLAAALIEALEALRQIQEMKPREKDFFPPDWKEQIAACPDCQSYKDHPIQRGICDTHRKPIYAREYHNSAEEKALGYRMMFDARDTLTRIDAILNPGAPEEETDL